MPTVSPYSRAVMKPPAPRASSRSTIGRRTSGCAAAVQSTQIFIGRDPSDDARSEDSVLADQGLDPGLAEERLQAGFDLAPKPAAFLEGRRVGSGGAGHRGQLPASPGVGDQAEEAVVGGDGAD